MLAYNRQLLGKIELSACENLQFGLDKIFILMTDSFIE